MAVSIRFHGRHDTNVPANVFTNHSEVMRERIEIDLSPGWASGNVWWFGQAG